MSSARTLLRDILAATSRHAVGIAVGVVTVGLVAHRLGAEALGLWTLLGTTGFLLGLADLGLSTAVARAIAANNIKEAHRAVGVALLSISIVAPTVVMLAVCFAGLGIETKHGLTLATLLVTVGGSAAAWATPYRTFLLMSGRVSELARYRMVGALTHLVVIVVGLALVRSLVVPAAALFLGLASEAVLVVVGARQIDRELPLLPIRTGTLGVMRALRDGSGTLAINVAVVIALRADVFFLTRCAPLAAIAAYGVAARAIDQSFSLAKQASSALQSRLGSAETRSETLHHGTALLLSLVASGLVAVVTNGTPLLRVWVGSVVDQPLFAAALPFLASAAIFASLSEMACSALTLAAPSLWTAALPIVFGCCLNVGVSLIGMSLNLPWSIAAATTLGNLVTAVLAWRSCLHLVSWSMRDLGRALAPGLAALAASLVVGFAFRSSAQSTGLSLAACIITTLTGCLAAVATMKLVGREPVQLRREESPEIA